MRFTPSVYGVENLVGSVDRQLTREYPTLKVQGYLYTRLIRRAGLCALPEDAPPEFVLSLVALAFIMIYLPRQPRPGVELNSFLDVQAGNAAQAFSPLVVFKRKLFAPPHCRTERKSQD